MKIRLANKKDFATIWNILSKASELQADAEGGTYDKEWLHAVLNNKKENLALIAEEGVFLGFLIAHYLNSVKQTILNDLFVVSEARRRGIAQRLAKECERISKKKGHKYLTGLVLLNNKKMQNFMGKLRFKRENKFYFYEKRI